MGKPKAPMPMKKAASPAARNGVAKGKAAMKSRSSAIAVPKMNMRSFKKQDQAASPSPFISGKKALAKSTSASAKGSTSAVDHAFLWSQWTKEEQRILKKLDTPAKIQLFLDNELSYDPKDGCRSVRSTLQTKQAHCLGGCFLGYYLLTRLGYEAFCVGLDAVNDDAHAICVYTTKVGKVTYYGALSKSNFSLIRSRDCVYTSVRELVMSYWDFYFNLKGEKTLIGYNGPFAPFRDYKGMVSGKKRGGEDDRFSWLFNPAGVDAKGVEAAWDMMPSCLLFHSVEYDTRQEGKKQPGVTDKFGKTIFIAPKILVTGGTLDANKAGIYKC